LRVAGLCKEEIRELSRRLGLPEEHLRSELEKLGLPGWRLRFTPGSKHGIGGTRADVDLLAVPLGDPPLTLSPRGSGTAHRAHRDIRNLIGKSLLSKGTKDRALSIFSLLAGGFARCAHGLIPVPAPAVVELLRGVPVKSGAAPFETPTPTGAPRRGPLVRARP
jgi:uncharacterized protein (DUF111 family)